MRTISLLLYGIAILSIFVFGFLLKAPVKQAQATGGGGGWSTCVSTGPQCGTANGTQSKTLTEPRDFDWACPEGSSYSQHKCWREITTYKYKDPIIFCPDHYHEQNNGNWNQRCHRNFHWMQPEHKAPTGTACPWGYDKIGDGETTQCRKTVTDYEEVPKIKQYKACPTGWNVKDNDESKCIKTKTQECQLPEKDYSSCPPVGECPIVCGSPASQVPDGRGGTIQCPATDACPVDVCPNLEDEQEQIPDGYELVEGQCVKKEEPEPSTTPEPTVTPAPQPTPTPSPTPDDGKSGERSSLAHDNLQCPNSEFEAVMDVKRDGNGVKDVKVVFNFNGVRKEATTNDGGRAKVSFVIGNGTLTAEPEGFPSQALNIQAPECGAGIGGDTSEPGRGGQVLGATTLAETGNQSLYTAILMMVGGLALSAASYYGYNYINKDN